MQPTPIDTLETVQRVEAFRSESHKEMNGIVRAILVNSTLFFTTFNSKPIPNTIYVTDFSYYGTTKLTPTSTIKLNVDVSSEIEIDNQTYYGESQTIPEFAGKCTINISSAGFVNYTTVIDLRPFETLYLNVTLEAKLYGITFTESGLTTGTSWAITLNGNVESSSTNTITFTEPNGTYDFSIGNTTGYTVLPQSGVVAVSGRALTESIFFTQTSPNRYFVGFVSTANATIYVNATAYSEQNGSFNISLSPGTYVVKVVASGFTTYYTNITVSSSTVTSLSIHSLSRTASSSSFPLQGVAIIAIAVVIVAAIAAFLLFVRRRRG